MAYPKEFKTKLRGTPTVRWGNYVNVKGSDKSPYFLFEREGSGAFDYHTERPIWNVKHTHNGYDYEVVGCVTAFDGDEVRCTFSLPDNPYGEQDKDALIEYSASGLHPFEAFENAIQNYLNIKGADQN